MSVCVFCEILAGRAPGSFVHRDGQVAAIMDICPVNPGHLLVIPVEHASCLSDLPAETGGRMFGVARRLACAARASGLRCEGVNLLLADGACAGQEVFHAHLHVIPRFSGDGCAFRFREGYGAIAQRGDLDRIAETIRVADSAVQR